MQAAADIIGEQLFTPFPVVVRGCWESLGGDDSGAVLAGAFSNLATINTPGLPQPDTFHSHSVVQRLAGTVFCNLDPSIDCGEQDIFIRFNTDIDGDALGTTDFYYGISSTAPSRQVDFVSTALHEMTHGLGSRRGETALSPLEDINFLLSLPVLF